MDQLRTEFIDDQKELERLCKEWEKLPAIGLDTEFIRTRTFFPKLGLIQISDGTRAALIDPFAIDDPKPLAAVIQSKKVVKVIHSCAEDLEVLQYLCGEAPFPVFDTQVAAAYTGYGYQVGYQHLVREIFDIEIEKDETRSNWLKRPLTEAQVRYASLDVTHLLPLYETLSESLDKAGRLEWIFEDVERIRKATHRLTEPDKYYLNYGSLWRYKPRELAALELISTWREEEAMHRDLPRGFIMSDQVVRRVIKEKPESMKQLARIEGVRPAVVRRSGKDILGLLKEAQTCPEETLPSPPPRPPHPRKASKAVEVLRAVAATIAKELELPIELVATKKNVTELVRNAFLLMADPVPCELVGWRKKHVAIPLLDQLKIPEPLLKKIKASR